MAKGNGRRRNLTPLLLGVGGVGAGAITTAVILKFLSGKDDDKKGPSRFSSLGDRLAEAITGSSAQGRFSKRRSIQASRSAFGLIRTARTPEKRQRFNLLGQRAVRGTRIDIPGGKGVAGAFIDLFG